MKPTILFITLLIFTSVGSAQDQLLKNTISLGGNVKYSSQTYEGSSESQDKINITPQFDYFLIDNLSLGIILNIENTSIGTYSELIWGVGPNIRYYFNLGHSCPFLGVSYIFADNITKYSDENKYGVSETQVSLNAGMEFFISDELSFEPILSYKFVNQKLHDSSSHETTFTNGKLERSSKIFEIGFGLKYFIF